MGSVLDSADNPACSRYAIFSNAYYVKDVFNRLSPLVNALRRWLPIRIA
jgi:hypothetical protein